MDKIIALINTPIVKGILRHLLTAAGGALLTQGVLTDGQVADAIGALVTLAGIIWSVVDKRRTQA